MMIDLIKIVDKIIVTNMSHGQTSHSSHSVSYQPLQLAHHSLRLPDEQKALAVVVSESLMILQTMVLLFFNFILYFNIV